MEIAPATAIVYTNYLISTIAQLVECWCASLAGPGSNPVMSQSQSAFVRGNPIMLLPTNTFLFFMNILTWLPMATYGSPVKL